MNDEFVCKYINLLGESLLDECIVLNFRYHITKDEKGGTSVLSRGADERGERNRDGYVYVSEYIKTLEKSDYSFLLNDGGIIQISFHFDTKGIREYRYVYFPCPVRYLKNVYSEITEDRSHQDQQHEWHKNVPEDECNDSEQHWPGYSGDDYRLILIHNRVDKLLERINSLKVFQTDLVMMAPIRFEWNRDTRTTDEGENELRSEPASHVHLGFSKGRLAVSRPVTLWAFVSFVLKHYYHKEHDRFEESSKLSKMSKCRFPKVDDDCIHSAEKSPFYIETVV